MFARTAPAPIGLSLALAGSLVVAFVTERLALVRTDRSLTMEEREERLVALLGWENNCTVWRLCSCSDEELGDFIDGMSLCLELAGEGTDPRPEVLADLFWRGEIDMGFRDELERFSLPKLKQLVRLLRTFLPA